MTRTEGLHSQETPLACDLRHIQLQQLVQQAQSKEEQAKFAPMSDLPENISAMSFFEIFKSTGLAQDLYIAGLRSALKFRKSQKFKEAFRQSALELISYGFVASKETKQGNTVIVGAESMEKLHTLHDGSSLDNDILPGGVIVNKQGKISGIIRYAASTAELPDQVQAFRRDVSRLQTLHDGKPRLILVTPMIDNTQKPPAFMLNLSARHGMLPFTNGNLGSFLQKFRSQYAPTKDDATLDDVRIRKAQQVTMSKFYAKDETDGEFHPGYRDYLAKHGRQP